MSRLPVPCLLSALGLDLSPYTPAGLRGGGAVAEYARNPDIASLMWRMRLESSGTLASYLQEVSAATHLKAVPQKSRDLIRDLSKLF